MDLPVPIILAAGGGLVAGLLLGYLLRSYVSYRRRRRRRGAPLGAYPLSPPVPKNQSQPVSPTDLAAATLAPDATDSVEPPASSSKVRVVR